MLDDASFPVYGGEILGIAGISGSGQKELLEAIAGLQPAESGASIEYYAPDAAAPVQLVGKSPKAIREAGIHLSFVPEDRLGMGLVGSMGMTDNMMLKSYGKGHSPIVDRKAPLALAETIKKELGVVTPDLNTPVSRLSGGNVQKVLVGREIAADPIVLMTAYAVRGLDINTSYTIYHLLNEQKKHGVAVIYVGEDLDVLLELCDRIRCAVRRQGQRHSRWPQDHEGGGRSANDQPGKGGAGMSQTATAAREPLLRIAKREGTTMPQKIAVRAIAILLALVVDALFIFFVTGLNPLSVYGVMWSGTFANMTRFSWMLRDLSTLLCVGIALAPAFKMRFWNCGGEGQILIGGLTAALIMVYQGNNLPLPLLFAAMALGSIAAGALWGFIPAWFKSRWNTNETLFTLMMNYVATSIVACMTNMHARPGVEPSAR